VILQIHLAALRETAWHEYLVRFVLGGAATVATGLVAHIWGPSYGGLFLAFPAIFSASATLIEKHEERRKARCGLQGRARGKSAAALDAVGAALGSTGLMMFGAIIWLLAGKLGWWTLPAATFAWGLTGSALWALHQWAPRKIFRS